MSRELLFSVTSKDLDVQTFTSGGPGGQHQNKVATGVRITHRESGAVGVSRDTRSQHANKKAAFDRMANSPRFRAWIRQRVAEIESGKDIEDRVNEQMTHKNLKVEVRGEDGKWTESGFVVLGQ